jgi:hypothetical protein
MKNQFVTYEIARKLKELGFKEGCFMRFDDEKGEILRITSKLESPMYNYDDDIRAFPRYCAPLWQQTIDWLREKHGIELIWTVGGGNGTFKKYWGITMPACYAPKEKEPFHVKSYNFYTAREAAILKALELITKQTQP